MRGSRYSKTQIGPCLLVLSLSVRTAFAEGEPSPKERDARALFELGVEMSKQERWEEAERLFARADALAPRASAAYNCALALYRLGRARAAVAELDQFLERSDVERDARDRTEAVLLRDRALAALATVVVDVTPATAQVQLDGEGLSAAGRTRRARVDPGAHSLTAQAPGFATVRQDLSVSAGDEKHIELALAPEARREAPKKAPLPSRPSSLAPPVSVSSFPNRAAPWAFMALGGATFVAATVTGSLALGLNSRIASRCTGNRCPADLRDDQDRLNALSMATDILWATGGVLAGTGVAWYFISAKAVGSRRVRALVSPSFISVAGVF